MLAVNIGLMALYMRVSGRLIKLKVMEDCYMQTVMFMREIGLTIKPRGKEITIIQMERFMPVNGNKINNMGSVGKSG